MNTSTPDIEIPTAPAMIPHGVADYFWAEAADRRQLAERMLTLFRTWGYGDVILPAFEYVTSLARGASEEFLRDLYRFTDRDGSALALRADMTIAVARLVATRLHDVAMPQRFCYADSVFRYARTKAGLKREFFQAGVELIGAASPAADAEVLALASQAMRVAGLPATRIAVGHLGFFNALINELSLTPDAAPLLIRAIDSNSDAEMAEFLRQSALSLEQRRALAELAHLSGDNPADVLARGRSIVLNAGMAAALDNLQAILDAVATHALANPIFVDLTEIHNLGYYTGITFEVLSPGLGFAVASGGRYDDLVGSFGRATPAVGAAFMIDRMLLARRMRKGEIEARPIAPHAVVNTGGSVEAQRAVSEWRRRGARVVVNFGAEGAKAHGNIVTLAWYEDAFMYGYDGHHQQISADAAWRLIENVMRADNHTGNHTGNGDVTS